MFFGSRDGWITKYDLWRLRVVAEVRAGLNMRNVAVSGDGRWVMAANYLPRNAVLFDADLNLVRKPRHLARWQAGLARVGGVRRHAAPQLCGGPKDVPELWEISYDPAAEPIHDGYVHDYRMGESIAKPGFQGVRRTRWRSRWTTSSSTRPHLRAGRHAAPPVCTSRRRHRPGGEPEHPPQGGRPAIAGMPHLGSGITFAWNGTTVLASPNLQGGAIDVVDMKSWKPVRTIATPGPGFFMRSHENTPFAWTDSMMSPTGKDTLTIIDKRTLEVVAKVREPGKTLAHIEFTKDGRYALASVWEMDGAVVVFDAQTFKEVKRLPMSKPVGKYNVWNKITRSEGTSH